jgi:hypothetical protein
MKIRLIMTSEIILELKATELASIEGSTRFVWSVDKEAGCV